MRMLHVKGWGWLEGDTKWTPESPAKMDPRNGTLTLLVVVVVGLPIVMPTTKQWGKVEVGLGFGN